MKLTPFLLLANLVTLSNFCAGCKSTVIELPGEAGKAGPKISDRRLFMQSGATYESGTDTNGNKYFKAKVRSSPQAEMMGEMAEGFARGLKP